MLKEQGLVLVVYFEFIFRGYSSGEVHGLYDSNCAQSGEKQPFLDADSRAICNELHMLMIYAEVAINDVVECS